MGAEDSQEVGVKGADGNMLSDGDSISIIKDLKIKSTSLLNHTDPDETATRTAP
ncbi:PhnA domain-containing protein [Amphibacillus cookii]|uniref:PhnA domain-containing protein n=1 Tax=Amphibacillus cookii TaxID=767787 RepID=UPI00195EECDC|nr:PhnA domain-containing protein [Amphibacillus cookii]MBM7542236.1 putative Zn ribbon protein [Amphibacillus cookii]